MNRDTAVANVQDILGFKRVHATKIVNLFQKYQTEMELSTLRPAFLLSEDSTAQTTIGDNRLPLPSDFLAEFEDGALWYAPTDATLKEVKLYKDYSDYLQKTYGRVPQAKPEAYAAVGNYFLLYPTPDAQYSIKMRYYQKAALLTTNIENVWLKHVPNIFIGRAGSELAASLRDWKAKATFDALAAGTIGLLAANEDARENVNMDLQIGGPH